MAKSKAKANASRGKAKLATAKKAPAKGAKGAKKAAPKKAAPKKAAAKKAAPKKAAAKKAAPKKAAVKNAAPKKAAKKAAPPKVAATKATPAKAASTTTTAPTAPSATKTAADAYAAAIEAAMPPPTNGQVSLGTLRLENYRKPFAGPPDALSENEKTQLTAVVGDQFSSLFGADDSSENEMAWLEYIDVVDTNSGNIVANLLIWPYGDGAVVHHGTTKMIASIVQHGISPHETTGKAWMADFAKAWAEGAPRLGVSSPNHFDFSPDQVADADD
ncbi:MAG: hypothetical protein AB7T06_30055 [Kofleriaceae bacterium]